MKIILQITFAVIFFIIETSGFLPAQKTQLNTNLKSGTYSVGFKVVNAIDFSRVYKTKNPNMIIDKYSNGKPIQILIWYPAENEKNNPKMTFEDYLALEIMEEFIYPPSEKEKKEYLEAQINYLTSIEKEGPDIKNLLTIKTLSVKNLKSKNGNFPLIIYGAGADGPAFENFIICEYLASYGYIIAACPSLGPFSHQMKINSVGLEAQTRDLEFIFACMLEFPNIDQTKTAVIGWSWGGLAAMIMQMRNPNIDAVISLDGAIAVHEDKAKQIPGFNPSKLHTPYMFMSAKKTQSNLSQFFKKLKYSKAYQLNFLKLSHDDFGSINYSIRTFMSDSGNTSMKQKKIDYELICRFSLYFLNAFLKGAEKDLEDLINDISSLESNKEILTISVKEPLPLPPTNEEFIEILTNEGYEKAYKIYKIVKLADPQYVLFEEEQLIEQAFIFFNELNKPSLGINTLKLNIIEYPDSYRSYGYLGRLFEKKKDWKNGLVNYCIAFGMALREKNKPAKDIEWYQKKIKKIKENLKN